MKPLFKSFIAGLLLLFASAALLPAAPAPVTLRIVPEHEILPAHGSHKTVLQILIETEQLATEVDRPPLNLCLVMDRSGSMQGDRIARARDAALAVINRLGSEDIFSLVTYDSTVETIFPAGRVRNKAALAATVRRIEPRGMTALYGGVSQGAAELRKHLDGPYIHRMILISDGIANVGPSSPDDLARLGTALSREGLPVTTIGLGLDYNEDLMTRLAARSQGNTYFVEASRDLPRILDAELGDTLSVVARDAVLEIELPEGVRALRTIGSESTLREDRVEVRLNQLQGGQQHYVLLEVEVHGGATTERLEIGQARLRYRGLKDDSERMTEQSTVRVGFSEDEQAVRDSLNVTVQKEYLRNEMAWVKDRAIDLTDQGQQKEAAQLMRSYAATFSSAPAAARDPALMREVETLQQDSDTIEAEGMDNRSRKAMRAESYQIRSQQKSR